MAMKSLCILFEISFWEYSSKFYTLAQDHTDKKNVQEFVSLLLHRKVEQVSEEAESFRASLDKYLSRHQKRIQEAQERAELLGRASGDSHVLRIFDEEAQAVESVRRSSRLLEESFATGVTILTKYSEQRDHLKVPVF
ncbi:UNVERIFIED_CONTAM: Membrin-11 [Sesamum radiatum]|uniref:Membrin-11 n=1 Tax=Sesamum radiatum TaxID=300843 RepID=A0AAW2NNX1_SESRA